MTKTIKLSKNFEKAIDSLNRIEKLSKEFGAIFSELTVEEKDLIGGLVIGVYSPIDNPWEYMLRRMTEEMLEAIKKLT